MQPIHLVSWDQRSTCIVYSWETVKKLQPLFNPCSKQHYNQINQEMQQRDLHLYTQLKSSGNLDALLEQYQWGIE